MKAERAPIRILTVDDHSIIRQGIAGLISVHPDTVVVAEATNGREAIQFRTHQPDITLMDVQMPEMNGLDALISTIETIPSETMHALAEYSWPGNIRELQNLIERSVILTSGPVLRVPLEELEPATQPKRGLQTGHDAERDFILDTLKKTKWVVAGPNGAAQRLGMRRTTLQYRIRKLGITKQWH